MKSRRSMTVVAAGVLLAASATVTAAEPGPVGATVSVNGIEMYYEVSGDGPPLLLLHGGTGSGRMFDPFVAELGARYRLVVPDLRGHGRSTNPNGEWSTRQFARDIFALLDHLGIDRCSGIGTSAGGMTLLHMATMAPERVEAMVVVGVGTYLPVSCREILAQTSLDGASPQAWERLRSLHHHGDDQIRALYAWVASLADSYNDMTFTPAYLATVSARTLVVHGDRDYCFPIAMAAEVYAAIPDAYLWVVPNGGHVPLGPDTAEQFTTTVLRFLGGEWSR